MEIRKCLICGNEIPKYPSRSVKAYSIAKYCSMGCAATGRRKKISIKQNCHHNYSPRKGVHPIYNTWKGMRHRCRSTTNRFYRNYGGRGIDVCDEWYDSFFSFCEWAQLNGWEKGLSLDRINNDGNYEPMNCRWTTHKVQLSNTRHNRLVTHNGKTQTVKQWANELGMFYTTFLKRLNKWSIEDAFEKTVDLTRARVRKGKKCQNTVEQPKTSALT